MIQAYSQEALDISSVSEFAEITIEYFIEIFNQAKGVICEYDEASTSYVPIGSFGHDEKIKDNCKKIVDAIKNLPRRCSLLSSHDELIHHLSYLNLFEAYVCPIYFNDQNLSGFVIVGQTKEDSLFYPPLNSDCFSSFSSMCKTVGVLLKNFHFQKSLEIELKESKSLSNRLTVNTAKLTEANEDLALEVSDRSLRLEKANKLLKQEIEERELIEQKLRNQAEELKRSNEDLTQFASVISHDLKSPLRAVMGFTELFYQKYFDIMDSKGVEYLEFIRTGVKNFSNIIDDLLEFSKVSNIDATKKKVNLNELVQKVLSNTLYRTIDKKQAIIATDPLPEVIGDPYQLESLFQNLIENALKFTDNKKPIIKIKCANINELYQFSISDNGIGIDKKFSEKIFKLFERLHTQKEYEGTGLGLTISKKIVDRHQGKIWFESVVGKGTTFYFTLPKTH